MEGTAPDGRPTVQPPDRAAWRSWLSANHTTSTGAWVVTFKKASGKPRLEYDEIVEEALCFGWIDSKPNKLDDERTMLWLAPRKPKSAWSRPNKERIEEMMAAGLMAEAGLRMVEMAKESGTWDLLNDVENLVVPDDLAEAFARHPGSRGQWDGFSRSSRRGILEWIIQAKKPETRAVRVEETARLAAAGEKANQWSPRR
jgi:uncharacterized protein YdeI (YjbR/CyaY-like superfamily)